jgi:hypothetical protein
MYKFAIIGTLLIDSKKYTAGPKGLIIESKELADRISEVIGSDYITLEAKEGAPKKRKSRAKVKPEEAELPSED